MSSHSVGWPGIRVRIAMGHAGTLLRWLEAGEVDDALLYGVERSSDMQVPRLSQKHSG